VARRDTAIPFGGCMLVVRRSRTRGTAAGRRGGAARDVVVVAGSRRVSCVPEEDGDESTRMASAGTRRARRTAAGQSGLLW
jgi:hypothetical protein